MIKANMKDVIDISRVPRKYGAVELFFRDLLSTQGAVVLYKESQIYPQMKEIHIIESEGGFKILGGNYAGDRFCPDLESLVNEGLPRAYASL